MGDGHTHAHGADVHRRKLWLALAITSTVVVGLYAAVEGVRRLFDPPQLHGPLVMAFGVVGLVANLASIAVLHSSRDANFNIRHATFQVEPASSAVHPGHVCLEG